MYSLKPINDLSQPISVPDIMYRLKPINDPGEVRGKEGCSSLSVLERRQESILCGLAHVKSKLSAHKVSLGLGAIPDVCHPSSLSCDYMLTTVQQHQNAVLEKVDQIKNSFSAINNTLLSTNNDWPCNEYSESFAKQDIVVLAHPSHPPFGIFLAYHQLKARGLKIFTSCHSHSSITGSLPENVIDFLPAHPDDLTRTQADLIITIIWKKLDDRDPLTVVSPLMQHSTIKGEVNILRYLTRLYPSIWDYGSTQDPRVEYFLDIIHSDLFWAMGGRQQKEEAIFKGLESAFLNSGSSSFFSGGSEPGILDLVAWSVATRDHGKLAVPSTALKKWLTCCNKVCAFYGSRQHRISSHRHRRTSHGPGGNGGRRRNHSSTTKASQHKNNRKSGTTKTRIFDVEKDFAPGYLVSRQWPSTADVLEGDPCQLFISNVQADVTEKLDGSNVALSSNGVVASRRIVFLRSPSRDEMAAYVFLGVSLEFLWPHLATIGGSLATHFRELLGCPSLLITVFGELLQKGTASSKEDKFGYVERGLLPGHWRAFGMSIANGGERRQMAMLNELKADGFSGSIVQSINALGKSKDDAHIVINLNSRLEDLFRSFHIPTLETKTLPFNEIFETYEEKLLVPGSCEGIVINVPSRGVLYKWRQLSGGYVIKNGTFFKEKSRDPRYAKILQILKRVAGVERSEKVEDMLRLAYDSALTKYPYNKEEDREEYSTLITEEILKDLEQVEEINENEVRVFVMRQR